MLKRKQENAKKLCIQGVVRMTIFQQWEKVNEKLACFIMGIIQTENHDDVMIQKVKYSLLVLLSEFEKLLCLLFLFGALHRLLEFFVLFLTIIPIRIFMGGSHRKTMLGCFIQSLAIFGMAMALSETFTMNSIVKWMVYGILLLEIWMSTPIPSANRMNYNKAQKMGFKAKALTVLLILTWIESLLPDVYCNQIVSGLLVQSLEVATTCMYKKHKGKEIVTHEEQAERKVE